MGEHILVAEGDAQQARLIKLYLEREGYCVAVVHDGKQALASAAESRPRLIVLDVVMPEVDGLEVCRQLGGEDGIPVIFLTARSAESDILLGLYLGADDYIAKPFSPRELVARIRAVLRRATPGGVEPRSIICAGRLRIDVERHEVKCGNDVIDLTPVEFELLTVLAARPGRVWTRRHLLDLIRGGADYLTERTVDSHVMNVRRKIERDPRRPEQVLTVYGVGYKFAEQA